jgi:hypothetical protein
MDDTNPYASPRTHPTAAEQQPPASTEPTPGQPAWREGDVLVAPGKNASVPRACVLTNRTDGIWKFRLVEGGCGLEVLLALLMLTPFVGVLLAGSVSMMMLHAGGAAEVRLWLRRPIAVIHHVCESIAAILMLAANLLTGFALVRQQGLLLILGLVAHGASFALVYLPDRAIIPLRAKLGFDGCLRIEGAHPQYLDRLPELDAEQEGRRAGEDAAR